MFKSPFFTEEEFSEANAGLRKLREEALATLRRWQKAVKEAEPGEAREQARQHAEVTYEYLQRVTSLGAMLGGPAPLQRGAIRAYQKMQATME